MSAAGHHGQDDQDAVGAADQEPGRQADRRVAPTILRVWSEPCWTMRLVSAKASRAVWATSGTRAVTSPAAPATVSATIARRLGDALGSVSVVDAGRAWFGRSVVMVVASIAQYRSGDERRGRPREGTRAVRARRGDAPSQALP